MQTKQTMLYAVNCSHIDPAAALPLLTQDRVAHIGALRSEQSKRRSAAAGLLLRYAAVALLGCAPETVARSPGGKPYLPAHPDFHFSLSHSGDWAICAAGFTPVGVDIQHIRPVSDTLKTRFFTPAEQELCTDDAAAIRLFCAREAYGKYTGEGIGREEVHCEADALWVGGIRLREIPLTDGCCVCLCSTLEDAAVCLLSTEELLDCTDPAAPNPPHPPPR